MRLFLDVTSFSRWTGPPVGIARVEHALAREATIRPRTSLCFWDARSGCFRLLRAEWADTVLGWHGAIDMPAANQSWLSRHRLFTALERMRLTVPVVAPLAAAAQDWLLNLRPHGHQIRDTAGKRIAHVPPSLALGGDADIGPSDVLMSAGSDWFHLDIAMLREAKRRMGFRYACLCYDLIPFTHPQYYAAADVALVSHHWRAALTVADLVIANARCIAHDIANFAQSHGMPVPRIDTLPLGFDPPSDAPSVLPASLEPKRFILFVSTIEPRKGHAMLLRVWRRLLARGVPARYRFKLVFVGRPGWMVESLLRELAESQVFEGSVLHLEGLEDSQLNLLYASAAFCVYPSCYEGFGLPVIEAFARCTPMLASTGGALPETVGGLFPCLPPEDEDAWERTIEAWMEQPPSFKGATGNKAWPEAARAILDRAAQA